MAKSIIERVLGNTNPYAQSYITDTVRLTKSFIIHTPEEAETFNAYLFYKRGMKINGSDKTSWRYYKHLTGEYHEADEPMKIMSRDNRREFILSKESIELHIETKIELNLYGALYESIIAKYPEQELLLRSILSNDTLPTMSEVINYKKWQIVSYNKTLIEKQETNLIYRLQQRIDSFSVSNLITSYRIIDNLFMPTLIAVLYSYIYNSLLSIRLENCRTGKVHSYHILNYFASHHGLDSVYDQLDDRQRLYLYRNMNYLNAHAGTDEVFDEIIDKFFTYKDIVVTNYIYNRGKTPREDGYIDYEYREKIMNDKPLVYDENPKDKNDLEDLEKEIYDKNKDEYDRNGEEIDREMVGSDENELPTKDLEISANDNSNEVKYKLFDVFCDYWAATIEFGYNKVYATVEDPTTNKVLELSSHDSFKLFIIALHLQHEVELERIPDYHAWNIFKEDLPEDEVLFNMAQRKDFIVENEFKVIKSRVPHYRHMDTARGFRSFVEAVYLYELGVWMYMSSTGDFYTRYDVGAMYEHLHRPVVCHNDNEEVKSFLNRIDFEDIEDFSPEELNDIINEIISSMTNDLMERQEMVRNMQEAAITIFEKFKSYSTQILSRVNKVNTVLAGLETPYYSLAGTSSGESYPIDVGNDLMCNHIEVRNTYEVELDEKYDTLSRVRYTYFINIDDNFKVSSDSIDHLGFVEVGLCVVLNEELSTPRTIVTEDIINDLLI